MSHEKGERKMWSSNISLHLVDNKFTRNVKTPNNYAQNEIVNAKSILLKKVQSLTLQNAKNCLDVNVPLTWTKIMMFWIVFLVVKPGGFQTKVPYRSTSSPLK